MKTNYKIGETYYDYGQEMKLIAIRDEDEVYPLFLVRKNDGIKLTYTLDGCHAKFLKPTLSTSPTEFIAPKSDDEYYVEFSKEARDRIIKAYGITESILVDCKNKSDIKEAIQLLKSEGYTITKQY